MILLFEIKGAIQRVPKDAMAFDHREPNFEMSIIAHWTEAEHDVENVRWAREVWKSAQPYVTSAVYTNHMTADESDDRIRNGYGAAKYEKLAALKSKYDPDNFFRSNHNIRPQRP
jgi:FAD/FMN-containing dehydrogenase